MDHIALFEPQIPANTGSSARTCAATNTPLHLIEPLGFSTDDKQLKRAGLDYWHLIEVYYHNSIQEVIELYKDLDFYFLTTKVEQSYTQVKYSENCVLVFGKETKGLPESLLASYPDNCVRIPMRAVARSLNLSNSVAIITYEILRQKNFEDLQETSGYFS